MDDVFSQMITQAPNFVGFIVGLLALLQVIRKLQDTNDRLIDALIKRENCEDVPA
jgi:hypothetical protein